MGGAQVLRDNIPDFDCTVVQKFNTAGAVIVGKLNLTEGAMAGYNPEFQIPLNPWDPQRWSGASSSGSGAATAAGLCYGSLGSDTGGSIRFPSAACGIVGIKPTWGPGEPLRSTRLGGVVGPCGADDPQRRRRRDHPASYRRTRPE